MANPAMPWNIMPIAAVSIIAMFGQVAEAQDASGSGEDLAKQLSNPLAAMISVPFQLNYNDGSGQPLVDGNRQQLLLNVQPVIPFTLTDDWNLISRTILPVVYQESSVGWNSDSQFGLGNTTQSLWFSPVEPTPNGLIWGLGPVLYLPTATEDELGPDTWGAGPTVVGLTQNGPWTAGFLGNHIWSIDSDDINSTYLQPFLNYTTPSAWTFGLNTEASYDWTDGGWSVPINATLSKLININGQPVSLQGGVRYYAVSRSPGPDGWGARASVTFLFPRK